MRSAFGRSSDCSLSSPLGSGQGPRGQLLGEAPHHHRVHAALPAPSLGTLGDLPHLTPLPATPLTKVTK